MGGIFFKKNTRCRGILSIIACESGRPFAEKVFRHLKDIAKKENIRFVKTKETHFANSEIKSEILESVRGSDVYIIQDVENSTNRLSADENLRALKTMIDAAWRSDAEHITVILPAFPYARQDKAISRESVTAVRIAQEIESCKANRVVTLDVHNTAIAGFFRNAKFENLHASKSIMDYVKRNMNVRNLVVLSPDAGGAKRAEFYASRMRTDLGFIYKKRDYSKANIVSDSVLLGEVKGKDVLLVDDMIDTGGTVVSAVKCVKEKGARRIYFACSLPMFNGAAVGRLAKAYEEGDLTGVIGTDAVFLGEGFQNRNRWYKEVSVAGYFARVIYNINHYKSISELLK